MASIAQGFADRQYHRDEVLAMMNTGELADFRFELIDGFLISKMGQAPPHATAVRRADATLRRIFGIEMVQAQLPIEVATRDQRLNMPEPDLAVLATLSPEFSHRHPGGTELLLVVEIADASRRRDLGFKRDLYARAGVREYGVLDIVTRHLHAHRKPVDGCYTEIIRLTESATVSIECRPDVEIPVAPLLPPPVPA